MTRRSFPLTAVLGLWSLVASSGCATLHMPFVDKDMPKATARNPVAQIIGIWQVSEGRDPSGMPCRGFAGQILFLAGRGSLPVQVDGNVRVYVFDDQGTEEEQARPLHQFDFDSGSWSKHLTKGTLGPTYSVFVPYTRRGQHESRCELRIRYTTEDGQTVFSDMASITLPGKKPVKVEEESDVVHTEEAVSQVNVATQALRRTTTIPLGKSPAKGALANELIAETAPVSDVADSGRVQLVSHEVGSPESDPAAKRIEELEKLVQQLAAQRSGNDRGGVTQAVATSTTNGRENQSASTPQRIRLVRHTEQDSASEVNKTRPGNSPRHPLEAVDTEEGTDASDQGASAEPRRLPPEATRIRRPAKPHPLEDVESEEENESASVRVSALPATHRMVSHPEHSSVGRRIIRAEDVEE